MVQASGLPKPLRKHWFVALLMAILATETLILAIVLLEMTSKGTQSFPAFTLLDSVEPIILGF